MVAMLDRLSLDQLRTFSAAAEEGSFSAAARKLHRTQSMVSETIAKLEDQIGIVLFDRSGRYPKLTQEGVVLLGDARSILSGVDGFRTRARGMASGLEPELAVVVDVFVPIEVTTMAAREFGDRFPGVPLRLYVEALGGAYQPVIDGRASVGVVGPLPILPSGLATERMPGIVLTVVAAADHPLARVAAPISPHELARHTQLVLTDRSALSAGREFGVVSASTWRLADLFAKHAFLLSGLGWGSMPKHIVAADIAAGRLVALDIDGFPSSGLQLEMSIIYQIANPPGPAGRWMINRLRASQANLGTGDLGGAGRSPHIDS